MFNFQKITQFKNLLPIDFKIVSNLYALSERSLLIVIVLSIITSYYLYPVLGITIIIWNFLLLVCLTFRLFNAISFKKDSRKYSLDEWYKKFKISAYITAIFFSTLAFFVIPYTNNIEYHFFVVILLVGLSAGSGLALSSDYRIAIIYEIITLSPLFIVMLFQGGGIYMIIALLIIVYLSAKILMLIQGYNQYRKILQQEKQINKVKKNLKEKQNLLYNFVEKAPIAIFSYDTDLQVLDGNAALLKLLQTSKDKIKGFDLAKLPNAPHIVRTIEKALYHTPQIYSGPYHSIQNIDLWIEARFFPFKNVEGTVIGGFCVIDDKTSEHTARMELEFLATHDALTSLLNRRGLKEYMNTFMKSEEHRTFYSLLFYLDLNKFKHINDSLGHKTGDELLVAISYRLKECLNQSSIISRFGGDEFIIISPFISDKKDQVTLMANRYLAQINTAFQKSFTINNMNLFIHPSIGIVTIEPNSINIEEIIRHADIAMYQAKQSHTDHTSYYNIELDRERKKLFLLQHDLSSATQNSELKIYLQPIVSMDKDQLIAAECLLRWIHPSLGLLPPNEFIPIAIETGLITEMTWWLIEALCNYISDLKQNGLWKLKYISINIDAKQLLVNHFVDEFLSILEKYHIQTKDIMIEITEVSIIDNFKDTRNVINILRNKGIKCAIDDFGIGYSSLSYLKKLSFDTLKIDREFVKDIQNRPDDIVLIKTIMDIGKQFNYHIVVEGIEEEKQKELLLQIDRDLIYQGYFFSRPIPTDEFTEKFLKH